MAIFALREQKYKQACTYAATQFLYSGKAKLSDRPSRRIANEIDVSESTVYRHFKWLLSRNWMGKDENNGWLFFRGLDSIHGIENWQFGRAAIMHKKDLQNIKAFLAGAVMASLVQTGKGQRTEQVKGCSEQAVGPISLSLLANTLNVSTKTAYRLRKLADKCNFITNRPNLVQITNWTPNDLTELKKQDVHRLPVELLGYADKRIASIDRIRYKKNKLFLQEPNLVNPFIQLKSRKGLSKYVPPNPSTNVSQQ
jgi:hypothetical protein